MRTATRNTLLALAVVAAGVTTAVAVERVAIAQGISDAGSASPTAGSERRGGSAVLSPAPASPTAAPTVNPDDPVGTGLSLLDAARNGKGRVAFGLALVLVVWALRSKKLLGKIAWFGTTLGGYVLAFGVDAIAYTGLALASNASVTVDLIADALVAGFAAAGKWEAIRDLAKKSATKAAAVTTALALVVTSSATTACKPGGIGPVFGGAIIDCVSKAEVKPIVDKMRPLLEGAEVDWDKILADAQIQGLEVGGCVVAELVQHYLAPAPGRRAPAPEAGQRARAALASARDKVNGATFRTQLGDL